MTSSGRAADLNLLVPPQADASPIAVGDLLLGNTYALIHVHILCICAHAQSMTFKLPAPWQKTGSTGLAASLELQMLESWGPLGSLVEFANARILLDGQN